MSKNKLGDIPVFPKEYSRGMTLLEYFSAQAMQGLLSGEGNSLREGKKINGDVIANISVQIAKDLIAELEHIKEDL